MLSKYDITHCIIILLLLLSMMYSGVLFLLCTVFVYISYPFHCSGKWRHFEVLGQRLCQQPSQNAPRGLQMSKQQPEYVAQYYFPKGNDITSVAPRIILILSFSVSLCPPSYDSFSSGEYPRRSSQGSREAKPHGQYEGIYLTWVLHYAICWLI